jgi:hypothetical protein
MTKLLISLLFVVASFLNLKGQAHDSEVGDKTNPYRAEIPADSIPAILLRNLKKTDIPDSIIEEITRSMLTVNKDKINSILSGKTRINRQVIVDESINPDEISDVAVKDSIEITNFGKKFDRSMLPVLHLSLDELNEIVPGSYEDGHFNIFIDYITDKSELEELRPDYVYSDIQNEDEFILRFKYENAIYLWDSTRFNSGVPMLDTYRKKEEYDKSLYVTFSEHIKEVDGFSSFSQKYEILSPMVEEMDLMPGYYETLKEQRDLYKELRNVEPFSDEFYKISSSASDFRWKIDELEFELKSKLIPVKVTPFRDYYLILWFYPTKEFITKLPERYREEMLEQYEFYLDYESGKGSLGETCVRIEGKKDYFGICEERRGAIEKISFLSHTTETIAADIKLNEARTLKIYIADMMGTIVHQEEQYLNAGNSIEEYRLPNLKAGPYFFVIESDAGELAIEKLFVD